MKKYVLCLIIFMMLFFNGCIEKKTNASFKDSSRVNNYLIYDLGDIPKDLIQLNENNIREMDLILAVFEGLVKVDENGEIVPGIAKDWIISEDGITYTFNLRENAKWSDGTKIKAEDFVNFFKEFLNPNRENIYAYQLYSIFGAEEYNKGKKNFDNVAIKAQDEKTLQIRLNSPTSYFLEILSQPIYTLREMDKGLEKFRENYKNIKYTGPFKIDDISLNDEITLLKNGNYYEPYFVKSEKIYINSSKSSESALASFKNSNINIFMDPPINEIKNLIIDEEAEVIPINKGSSINFNLKSKSIIKENDFRKAVLSSIDKKNLVEKTLNGMVVEANSYIPFNDKNNKILDKEINKNEDYDKSTSLKLIYLNSIENKKVCEAIAKNIKDKLGLNVKCIGYNEDQFLENIKIGDYDMVKVDYSLLYKDPLSVFEPWTSSSKYNLFGYNNSEFDKLIFKAKFEKDKNIRKGTIEQIEKIFINDTPSIPLYFYNAVLCRKNNVKGVYVTSEGNVKFDRAYIE
ncbi:peptide ABC transporter substrate-binding protein [Clostridium prolinivorans]|uniref:peptide ABC transporter substrate-binding protein n=1 Tax=Clostridium prolinivorans TaxID=2769420 RepID=UPI0013E3A23D|nr:peptide ABC transporter substrate-binding protein [Clostridium prolinivorans]